MELSIAMERYEYSDRVVKKLDYSRWTDFIDQNTDYYIWLEQSKKGKERIANIDKIPESFRSGILEQLNKTQVFAEFNSKKGWHEIVIDFHKDTGVIKTTFMKEVTKDHLKRLLSMAKYLDAFLLMDGTQILDEKAIESLR